jgi:putative DNA primase/helicase
VSAAMQAGGGMTLLPNPGDIRAFLDALFRYAEPGTYVSLRAFDQRDRSREPLHIEGVPISGSLDGIVDRAAAVASKAANGSAPGVFAPPICTFKGPRGGSTDDLANGVALSVEMDEGRPDIARAKLESVLGVPATLVMTSGGEWADPDTGVVYLKQHFHWRLSEPTVTEEDHARLREARRLAAVLVGADRTAIPVVHPMRWPGSWNMKRLPGRLARNALVNVAAEIDLGTALEQLQEAVEAAGVAEAGASSVRVSAEAQAVVSDVASALAAIPNADVAWDEWNRIGMAAWRATGGSDAGLEAWSAWSAKSGKHDGDACADRWAHYGVSSPSKIGAGTLFFLAGREGWRRLKAPEEPEGFEVPPPADDVPEGDPQREEKPREQPEPKKARKAKPAANPRDLDGFDLTEDGVALAFVHRFKDQLRYCHHTGAWFQWNGSTWRREETKLAFSWARQTCRERAREAKADDKIRAILARAATAAAVERFAQSDRAFAVTSETWDRDAWLLGTPGGTVELRTGEMRPARPGDYITKATAVIPAPQTECPVWKAFLWQATGGDKALIRFLQQWCGYCLTGITREHALLFIYGPGGNGKSVFINTVIGILGDYCRTAPMDAFTAAPGDRPSTDLAMLRGARLVTATETEEGRAWAEARIKQMTGGDPVTARFMRQDFFTYTPQFKLTIAGNHKPALRNVDEAARRRFNIVPFLHTPPEPDRELEAKLREEWPGILGWMIDGCLDWQNNGLVRPKVVLEATDEYFAAQDTIGRWLAEQCILAPELAEKPGRLVADCRAWAAENGETPPTPPQFRSSLERMNGIRYATVRGVQQVKGIGLRPKPDPRQAGGDDA